MSLFTAYVLGSAVAIFGRSESRPFVGVLVRPHNLLTVENSIRRTSNSSSFFARPPSRHPLLDLLISAFLKYIDFAESVFLSWAVSCASYDHTAKPSAFATEAFAVSRSLQIPTTSIVLTYKATTQNRSSQSFHQLEFHYPNALVLNTVEYINTYPALSFHRSPNGP